MPHQRPDTTPPFETLTTRLSGALDRLDALSSRVDALEKGSTTTISLAPGSYVPFEFGDKVWGGWVTLNGDTAAEEAAKDAQPDPDQPMTDLGIVDRLTDIVDAATAIIHAIQARYEVLKPTTEDQIAAALRAYDQALPQRIEAILRDPRRRG